MSNNSSDNKIKKTLLTPCRRVGLKRKSLENSPLNKTFNELPKTSLDISNTSVPNVEDPIITPKRKDQNKHSDKIFKRKCLEPTTLKTDTSFEKLENSISAEPYAHDIEEQIQIITKRILEKRDKIATMESNLQNVKQHNLEQLNSLINKWRTGCQAALRELLTEYQNRDEHFNMVNLLDILRIPSSLVAYSETDMDFCQQVNNCQVSFKKNYTL